MQSQRKEVFVQPNLPPLVVRRGKRARERYDVVANSIFDSHERDYEFFKNQCFLLIKKGDAKSLKDVILKWKNNNQVLCLDFKESDTGNTPVISAALYNNAKVVNFLLKQDVDITLRNIDKRTAIEVASDDTRSILLCETKAKDLKHAAWQGNFPAVRNFLHKSCWVEKVNEKNLDGLTPLQLAARDINVIEKFQEAKCYNPLDVMKVLVQHKAYLEAIDNEGKTVLHHIVANVGENSENVLSFLLSKISKINIQDINGFSPLLLACMYGSTEAVKSLIQEEAVDNRYCGGRTLLHFAADAGHEEICLVLIEHGADVEALDDCRLSPLDLAKKGKHRSLFKAMVRRQRKVCGRTNGKKKIFSDLEAGSNGQDTFVKDRSANHPRQLLPIRSVASPSTFKSIRKASSIDLAEMNRLHLRESVSHVPSKDSLKLPLVNQQSKSLPLLPMDYRVDDSADKGKNKAIELPLPGDVRPRSVSLSNSKTDYNQGIRKVGDHRINGAMLGDVFIPNISPNNNTSYQDDMAIDQIQVKNLPVEGEYCMSRDNPCFEFSPRPPRLAPLSPLRSPSKLLASHSVDVLSCIEEERSSYNSMSTASSNNIYLDQSLTSEKSILPSISFGKNIGKPTYNEGSINEDATVGNGLPTSRMVVSTESILNQNTDSNTARRRRIPTKSASCPSIIVSVSPEKTREKVEEYEDHRAQSRTKSVTSALTRSHSFFVDLNTVDAPKSDHLKERRRKSDAVAFWIQHEDSDNSNEIRIPTDDVHSFNKTYTKGRSMDMINQGRANISDESEDTCLSEDKTSEVTRHLDVKPKNNDLNGKAKRSHGISGHRMKGMYGVDGEIFQIRRKSASCTLDDFRIGRELLEELVIEYKEAEKGSMRNEFHNSNHNTSADNNITTKMDKQVKTVQFDPSSALLSEVAFCEVEDEVIIVAMDQKEEVCGENRLDPKQTDNGNKLNTPLETCLTDISVENQPQQLIAGKLKETFKRNEEFVNKLKNGGSDCNMAIKMVPSPRLARNDVNFQGVSSSKSLNPSKTLSKPPDIAIRNEHNSSKKIEKRNVSGCSRKKSANSSRQGSAISAKCSITKKTKLKNHTKQNLDVIGKSKGKNERLSRKRKGPSNEASTIQTPIGKGQMPKSQRTNSLLSTIAEHSGNSKSGRKLETPILTDEPDQKDDQELINTATENIVLLQDTIKTSPNLDFVDTETEFDLVQSLHQKETASPGTPISPIHDVVVGQEYQSLFDFYIKGSGMLEINNNAKVEDKFVIEPRSSVVGQNESCEENSKLSLHFQNDTSPYSLERLTTKTSLLSFEVSAQNANIKILSTDSSERSDNCNIKSRSTNSSGSLDLNNPQRYSETTPDVLVSDAALFDHGYLNLDHRKMSDIRVSSGVSSGVSARVFSRASSKVSEVRKFSDEKTNSDFKVSSRVSQINPSSNEKTNKDFRESSAISEFGLLSNKKNDFSNVGYKHSDDKINVRAALPDDELRESTFPEDQRSEEYRRNSSGSCASNDPYKAMAKIAFDPFLVNSAFYTNSSRENAVSRSKKSSVISSISSRRSSQTSSFRRSSVSMQTSDGSESGDEDVMEWTKGNILGKGAFGTVYLGLTSRGRMTAVKQVELSGVNSKEAQKQFKTLQQEIDLLKCLKHRNIVRFLGTNMEKNIVNIFMEYVPGGSLAANLKRFGPLRERVLRRYCRQIVSATSYLHQNGVVHRDIKGANIMLTPSGVVKLIDFGCAKRLNLNLSNSSDKLKSVKGTVFWMAPEIIRGTGHDHKSDIWSIGCTVYEMATGKPPWCDLAECAAMYAIANYSHDVPKMPQNRSQNAKVFYNQCMTKLPKDRPSAEELRKHPFIAV